MALPHDTALPADPGAPPAQLRVQDDLGGMQVRVSGYANDRSVWMREGGKWLGLLGIVAVSGLIALCAGMLVTWAVFLAMLTAAVIAYSQMDSSRAARHTTLTPLVEGLRIRDDTGERVTHDWRSIRSAEVHGGSKPILVLQRYGMPAIRVPMELEPASHAVWLAKRLEADRHAFLEKRGTYEDVPKALRNLSRATE